MDGGYGGNKMALDTKDYNKRLQRPGHHQLKPAAAHHGDGLVNEALEGESGA